MEPAVRVAPAPTHPGANERLPRVDHLPRSDEAIVPEQLPGVEPLAAGACINPCLERTGVFGKTLSSFSGFLTDASMPLFLKIATVAYALY